MRRLSLLLAVALTIAIGVASAQDPAANPLIGKTFRSVEKLPGGDRPDGKIPQIHWTVKFRAKEFSWLHYDKISVGDYTFDAKTGAVATKGGPGGTFDAKTGVLTWGNRKYEIPKDK